MICNKDDTGGRAIGDSRWGTGPTCIHWRDKIL